MEILRPAVIRKLYRLRWEVEVSFLELTPITKAEQWHSKSVNGIYQEIYARFWLINYAKLQIHVHTQMPDHPLRDECQKPNFKFPHNFILMRFPKLLKRAPQVMLDFELLQEKSLERAAARIQTLRTGSQSLFKSLQYQQLRVGEFFRGKGIVVTI